MQTKDMTAQDCLNLLRTIKDVTFSTVDEEGLPTARIIDVMGVGEGFITFLTARGKDFHRELMHNPHVAIAGLSKEWQSVRLSGIARRVSDEGQREAVDRIFANNPSMCAVYPRDTRYILEAFVVDEGTLEVFDLATEPIFRKSLSLGGASVQSHGFVITSGCIGCGTCATSCPQQCISEGTPYVIMQEHCLHCGLCFERCPVKVIEWL